MKPIRNARVRVIEDGSGDKPIPKSVYPVIDTDLARDNLENNIPESDLPQD